MVQMEERPYVVHMEEEPCVVRTEERPCVPHMADIAWANAITEAFGTALGSTTGAAGGGRMA